MVKVGSMDSVESEQSESVQQQITKAMEPGITGGAKIGASGGRKRKQSKPIRMNYGIEPAEMVAPISIMPHADRVERIDDADHEMASMDMDDMQSALQCDLCDDRFANQGDLSDHVQSVHNLNNQPESRDLPQPIAFPTKYHMLGSQFLEHEAAKTIVIEPEQPAEPPVSNNEKIQYSPPPPPQLSEDSRHSDGGHSSPKSNSSKSSARIFHQDAYCDLCDREFCNKYFLKTHMANKHGIYDGSPVPNGSSSSVNGTRENGSLPNMGSLSNMGSLPNMVSLPNPVSLAAATVHGATVSVSHRKTSPPPTKVVTPPSSSLPLPLLSTPPQLSKPADIKMSTTMSTPTKPPGPDMEDYCEICQKHFCNKYYLRKHKQDVHGIIPDTPPTKRSRTTASNASSSSNTPSSLSGPLNIPHPALAGNGSGQHGLNGMPNLMFLNPFAPPIALLQGQQQGQQLLPGGLFPAGLLPPGLQMPPGLGAAHGASEPGQKTPTSASDVSPSSTGGSASESLRNMGILNSEAYCELCRKEFCNKYFLQIHRANKHGIIDDELTLPGAGGLLMPNFPLPEGLKLPEGIKMPESMKYPDIMKFPEGMKLPEGLKFPDALKLPESMKFPESLRPGKQESDAASSKDGDSRSEIPTPNGSEKSDKSENQKMPTIPDMKPDFNKLFPPTNSIEELKLAAAKSNEMLEHAMRMAHAQATGLPMPGLDGLPMDPTFSGSMFGNMIAAKLADRVVCELCNKEVCNKYFLKTHKMKVHGVDPSLLENDNSNSSTPSKRKESPVDGPTDLSNKSIISSESQSSSSNEQHKMPNEGELLKMGIDPEAYCEICKKEFCSKYFLKTHKLNIHGIKVENAPDGRSKLRDQGMMFSSSAFTPSLTTITSSSLSGVKAPGPIPSAFSFLPVAPSLMPSGEKHGLNPAMVPSLASSMPPSMASSMVPTMAPSMVPTMAPSMVPTMAPGIPGGLGEQRTWKWKEPVNATRVMCDLCNKELCNKYFLKTHMLNKHGIHWDVSTGQPLGPANPPSSSSPPSGVTPTSVINKPILQTPPVAISSSAVKSNGEDQATDLSVNKSPTTPPMPPPPPIQPTPNPIENKEPSLACEAPPKNGEPKPELTNIVSAKIWQVPQEYRPLGNSGKNAFPTPGGTEGSVAAKDRANDRSILDGDPFIQKCDICGLLFGEPVTLQLHKMQDHQINTFPNIVDASRSNLANVYGITLRKKYQRRKLRTRRWRRLGSPVGVIGDKVKSAIMNHLANHQKKKKYRCAHCQERFLTKALCQAHIRVEHPHIRASMERSNGSSDDSSSQKNGTAVNLGKLKLDVERQQSEGPITAKTNLDPIVNGNPSDAVPPTDYNNSNNDDPFLMQQFTLQQRGNGNNNDNPISKTNENNNSTSNLNNEDVTQKATSFASSMVYLPVLQKISQPVTVSFSLTPGAEQ